MCDSKLRRLAIGSSTSLEERLFSALVRSSKILGENWPSAFRNAVNYKPAFAYSAVRRESILQSLGYLRSPLTYDCSLLLDRFETKLAAVRGAASLTQQPQIIAELLAYYTFLLHGLTGALYGELLERHQLDRRWSMSRDRFLAENNIYSSGAPWPC
jgi:hypothetical protein